MLSKQFIRFCAVGVVNTSVDTILFTVLRFGGLPILIANIISTSVGLIVSLLLNYRYTFKGYNLTKANIAAYFAVTIFGLWILQWVTINGILLIDNHLHLIADIAKIVGHYDLLRNVVPKLASVVVTLTWNYIWYSKVIFKNNTRAAEAAIAQE